MFWGVSCFNRERLFVLNEFRPAIRSLKAGNEEKKKIRSLSKIGEGYRIFVEIIAPKRNFEQVWNFENCHRFLQSNFIHIIVYCV